MTSVDLAVLFNGLSALAVVGALVFAGMQVRSLNRSRAEQAALAIVTTTQSKAWSRAIGLLQRISPEMTIAEIEALGPDVVENVHEIRIRLETIGYMVYRRIVSLEMVDDLIGGVIIYWWERIEPFALHDRASTGNPKSDEWAQWLAERLRERRARGESPPAYER